MSFLMGGSVSHFSNLPDRNRYHRTTNDVLVLEKISVYLMYTENLYIPILIDHFVQVVVFLRPQKSDFTR